MSQNGDPKMSISIGIYSIEGPDVGCMKGGWHIYIYKYVFIYLFIYNHIVHICTYIEACRGCNVGLAFHASACPFLPQGVMNVLTAPNAREKF